MFVSIIDASVSFCFCFMGVEFGLRDEISSAVLSSVESSLRVESCH